MRRAFEAHRHARWIARLFLLENGPAQKPDAIRFQQVRMVRFDVRGNLRFLIVDRGKQRERVRIPAEAQAELVKSAVIGAQLRLYFRVMCAIARVELGRVHGRLLQPVGMTKNRSMHR